MRAGHVGIGTAAPSARLSVCGPAGENQSSIFSTTLRTSSGALGSDVNSELALASCCYSVDGLNGASLGIRAIRTALGQGWPTTAISLGMDVDDTVRAGAAIFLHAKGNVGIGTKDPVSILEAAASAPGRLGPSLTLTNTGGGPNSAVAIDFNTFSESYAGGYNPSSRICLMSGAAISASTRSAERSRSLPTAR
jgi:hypothetical protein